MSASDITNFEPIAVSAESTVVAEYAAEPTQIEQYQSEAQLEESFINLLEEQAYERLRFTSEAELIANLRAQLTQLNNYVFSDTEWHRFYTANIAGVNDGIIEKTRRIQEDHIQVLKRDDGTSKNIYLIDKQHIHNNRLQVINQYEAEGARATRFDVTVLVNGLPLVHVELKRRGVDIREAFNQINRYQRDSFWAGTGLFQYVQLFVISNGTLTKYYSNTTRERHVADQTRASRKQASNTYEFTSWWADANNKPIRDLMAFGKTFFAKHALLNILTKYCVFTADQSLLVMRPYQIVATERILQRIVTSTNYKQVGSIDAGGYVWHTTGSGKTLTSFKTAVLASRMPEIDKVLFVVDRKDLDYQTMKEYDRFEKGAANGNTSTRELKRQLEDPTSRIVVTTIQKLNVFVRANEGHPVFSQHCVIIFDECHRSQFGDMHAAIRKAFKKYHLFGFTGTPIFASNAGAGGNPQFRTTEQAFGDKLHTYTIVDAITDKNVLPFRVDYVNTVRLADRFADKDVSSIDTERALLAPERIRKVVEYVLEHFDQKTRRNESYQLAERRVRGFNSIFATASIDAAKRYYNAFAKAQQDLPSDKRLKIALIYSYAPNEDDPAGIIGDEAINVSSLDAPSRDFLDDAIADYNGMFATNYSTDGTGFESYYKDLSERLKNRDLDMVIVVNMFLTGFDATTMNTLWVDKNLRQHGLIQAYSRTNRILNSVKTYGSIVSFRDLEQATNDAISLFGNKEAGGVVLLRPYAEYYDEYAAKVSELAARFTPGEMPDSEDAQSEYIALFNTILRLRNILASFDDFTGHEILSPGVMQDYQSVYLELYRERRPHGEKEVINDDLVFEIELIKQVEINVDYILLLVRQLKERQGDANADTEIRATITRAVDASVSLRSKRDLIERFLDSVNVEADVDETWRAFISRAKAAELEAIIAEEGLNADETRAFVERAFRDGVVNGFGTDLAKALPPVTRFSPDGNHAEKKRVVLERLNMFFERFFGLG